MLLLGVFFILILFDTLHLEPSAIYIAELILHRASDHREEVGISNGSTNFVSIPLNKLTSMYLSLFAFQLLI
jgi:hypothetical protein